MTLTELSGRLLEAIISGIVPDNIIPVYCHASFPKEDLICDFLNLDFEPELAEKIVPLVTWYPLEEIIPVKEQG
ncbi:MAG: hypothetical protein R2758_04300 [Bacteroidales bacterium]